MLYTMENYFLLKIITDLFEEGWPLFLEDIHQVKSESNKCITLILILCKHYGQHATHNT